MKHTKLLVVALLVVLLASLSMVAMADETTCPTGVNGLHTWELTQEIAAGCTTQGTRLYVCKNTNCGASKVEYTNPLGHKFTTWTQISEATCAKPGVQQQICERCGHASTETIRYTPAATGKHDYSVQVAAGSPAGCTTDGMKPIIKCSVCGAIDPNNDGSVIKAKGHDIIGKEWEVLREAHCDTTGIIVKRCWNCNDIVEKQETPKANDHQWNLVVGAKPATCTTDGCKDLQECIWCGAKRPGHDGSVVKAFGHDINGVAWEVIKEATCATEGVIGRKCKNGCGTWVEKQSTPKNNNHDYRLIVSGVPATCAANGSKDLYQCFNCGATDPKRDGSAIKALGHIFQDWNTVPATCTTPGYTASACARGCGHINKVTIPATGHSATWLPVSTSNGYTMYELRCTICKALLASQSVKNGDKAPSGTVNTGKADVDVNYTGVTSTKVVETAKNDTKKATTKTSTAKKSTNTTNTAKKAAPKTETKAATVVTAEVPASAELKFGVSEYKVGDVDVKLNADFTFEAELAEGQIVALFADADALAKPAEGNFVALSATEATTLPEGFVPTLVAIVTEAELPTAQAAK